MLIYHRVILLVFSCTIQTHQGENKWAMVSVESWTPPKNRKMISHILETHFWLVV